MSKHALFGVMLFTAALLFPFIDCAAAPSKADIGRLKRSYDANEWHMERFMTEYVSLERQFTFDPKNPELIKRAKALKMQIDLLTRENELILNTLDRIEK